MRAVVRAHPRLAAFTVTLGCGKVLRRWLPEERVTPAVGVMIVLAGLGIGAVNEIVEFAATLILPHTNMGGYVNSGWGLAFDLVGALVAAWWLVRSGPGRRVAVAPAVFP